MQRAIVLLAAVGCGHPSNLTPDAGLPPVDAPADTPAAGTSALEIDGGGMPVTAWTFTDTGTGQHATATFVVRNTGDAATAPLVLATTATDLAIAPTPAPCDGRALAPNDYCFVALTYQPTATGDLDATLHIAGANADPALPVRGHAVTPSGGLIANVTTLDFGLVETGEPSRQDVLLENNSTSDITLGSLTATGGFTVFANNCPAPLTAGGACTITLSYLAQTANAAVTGTFTATSDANDVAVSLSALSVRRVIVGRSGTGTGTVTASPGMLTCTDYCTGLFLGAVTLTAVPDTNSLVGAWSRAFGLDCAANPSCAIPEGGAINLGIRFELASMAKAVSFTLTGGLGHLTVTEAVSEDYVACGGSCTLYYVPGAQVQAAVTTPEVFVGWTGACVTTDPHCNLGTIVNDRTATAQFAPDDRELRTLLPSVPTDAIAYAPDGDLVVAGARNVAKLAPTGELRWSVALDGPDTAIVLGVAVAPDGSVVQFRAGDITAPTTLQLARVSAAGVLQWTRTFPSAQECFEPYGGEVVAAPNGDAAILAVIDGKYTLAVFDAANNPRWTADDLRDCHAVAIGSDGIYHVADDAPDRTSQIRRYALDGTRLADQGALPPTDIQMTYALAVDASGNLAAHVADESTHTISVVTPTNTTSFAVQQPAPDVEIGVGVAFDSSGNIIAARDAQRWNPLPGYHLDQFSPAGALLWSFDKPGFDEIPYDASNLFWATGVAADASHHVSIAGKYNGGPWIETFTMP